MMGAVRSLRRAWRDTAGAMAIETALVAPILVALSLGGFEASQMVARNSELQSAIGEAQAIVMAATPDDNAKRGIVEGVIEDSTGLAPEQVTLVLRYRCGTTATLVADTSTCGSTTYATFVLITVTDTYVPGWTSFGIGEPVDLTFTRTVQIA